MTMSETEERKNTSSDESEQSSGETKGTSKTKGKLYTDAQIHQIKTTAGGEAGRLRQAAERERDSLKEQLQSTSDRLNTLESERTESRLAEAQDNPEAARLLLREEALKRRTLQVEETLKDLTRREGQLKADRTKVDEDRGVISIAYTAAKHGLEVEELESLGISDPEILERVAEKLAARKVASPTVEGEAEEPFVPDTGETTGSGQPTPEQLEKMPMSQYAAYVAKRDAKK